MCLIVNSKRLIAEEDIICYKCIISASVSTKEVAKYYKEGDTFSGIIRMQECEGKIHYENNNIYFCTNYSKLNGIDCKNKLGFLYSWEHDVNVTKLDRVTSGKFFTYYQTMQVKIGKTYKGVLEQNNYSINIGFHAYINKTGNNLACNVQCIIPKGSEYYLGLGGDIVADSIKYEKLI